MNDRTGNRIWKWSLIALFGVAALVMAAGGHRLYRHQTQAMYPLVPPNVHSLFFYICPGKECNPGWADLPKPPATNFYKTNPEFFSMDRTGKRVDTQQLCFSNRKLRETFTAHLLGRIKAAGGRGIVSVSANDVPGDFCSCPDCMALAKKYQCPSGPLFDYLIEACGIVAKAYPEVYVTTLAYRKTQSEAPPAVKKLPDNLIVVFAPIDDNFAATLDDPTNLGTLNHLKQWVAIAKNVWVWYYTNPYLADDPPFGNIERMAADVKLLHRIGVSGTFYEHDVGVANRWNFSELQTWLLLKLFQNPGLELQPLVTEFTDFHYGPAAPLVRSYLAELESLRKQMTFALPWSPSAAMYRYLSPENIVRWQKSFDLMEKAAANSPQSLENIKTLRTTLDIAALDKWQDVNRQFPGAGMSIAFLENRIKTRFDDGAAASRATQPVRRRQLDDLLMPKVLLASARVKPVPASLAAIPPEKLRQAFPLEHLQADPEAAVSLAVKTELLEVPLTMGVYDASTRKWTTSAVIPANQLKPGAYQVYKVGQTTLSPQCCFWLTQQWFCTIPLEQFYVLGNPLKKWDVYASIKVDGPRYGHSKNKADKNVIPCDRIVLVERP